MPKATMPTLPLVAYDETGNTGQHLLDPAQPVFVLASVHLDDARTTEALRIITPPKAPEAKFSTLRTSAPGRRRVIELLQQPWIVTAHVKALAYHKPYMVTTKIVDMLIEELAHAHDVDLYANGGALATANALHVGIPALLGAHAFANLQERFVRMVRYFTPKHRTEFYDQVQALYDACTNDTLQGLLATLLATDEIVEDVVEPNDVTAMDPAIPTFFDLTAQWSAELDRPFDIAHDASKPLSVSREYLELLMTTAEPGRVADGPGPRRQLPLLATGLRFADSRAVPQVQVADVIAGAVATVYRAAARREADPFAEALLRDTKVEEIVTDLVWPSRAVSPAEFGSGRSAAPLNYIMDLSARERARRAPRGR